MGMVLTVYIICYLTIFGVFVFSFYKNSLFPFVLLYSLFVFMFFSYSHHLNIKISQEPVHDSSHFNYYTWQSHGFYYISADNCHIYNSVPIPIFCLKMQSYSLNHDWGPSLCIKHFRVSNVDLIIFLWKLHIWKITTIFFQVELSEYN